MSDPKYGEPVEEPTPVDDVVGSARAGLADAQASRDAVSADDWDAAYAGSGTLPERTSTTATPEAPGADALTGERAAASDGRASDTGVAGVTGSSDRDADRDAADRPADRDAADRPADRDSAGGAAATAAAAADRRDLDDADRREADRRDAVRHDAERSDTATRAYGTDDRGTYGGVVSASEPVAGPDTTAAAAPQPIFVQAPEAPTPRGNRGAAGAIGLLAALAFALIYLGASLAIGFVVGDATVENVGTQALSAVTSWWFWVPVAVFFLGFWILGAIINRGRWGLWVIFGLLVGLAAYAGHILGQLFQAPFWSIAPSEALTIVAEQAFAPLALVALVAGRELTIWFGAWVAARGRRVTELNAEAQREYERTLEAGPQLHRY
ncbi:ABC transporter [Microbacterium radiodurans]|uniref:ABC transporter n=1 Tax=Microbacterium radiodurans TaxID=661398 RepID=UPI001CC7B3C2|nr:ABC transporter [Microbacterium radiodurans]